MKDLLKTFTIFVQRLWDQFFTIQSTAQRRKFSGEEWLFYATQSIEERLRDTRKHFIIISKAIIIFVCLLLLLGAAASFFKVSSKDQLQREDYGGTSRRVGFNVTASYDDCALSREIEIVVLPRELTLSEEEERLNCSIAFLRRAILGENKGFAEIVGDLNLVLYDSKNGVSISWESSMPQYINAQGEVRFLELKKQERVVLTAHLSIGKSQKSHSFVVFLIPSADMDFTGDIRRNIERTIIELSKNKEGAQLALPLKSDNGVMFEWSLKEQGIPLFLIPICFLVLLFLYFTSNDSLVKEAKNRKAAIEEEIPNLALQLILLLNAGLIVPAAFQEILVQNKTNEHPFYAILKKLAIQSDQSNESFIKSFYTFAQRSGNRNLIRLMTLVLDHETKGSTLAEKLQREKDILWESRLQRAKAKAKEAETKLCLPLMLLLLVLVTISIAPALLEL